MFSPGNLIERSQNCQGIYNGHPEEDKDLETDPFVGKPLRAGLKGLWSLRVGKYRVVYKVVREEGIVQLITIGHRKKVYRVR